MVVQSSTGKDNINYTDLIVYLRNDIIDYESLQELMKANYNYTVVKIKYLPTKQRDRTKHLFEETD